MAITAVFIPLMDNSLRPLVVPCVTQMEIAVFGLLETEERSSTVLPNVENHSPNNDTANIRVDPPFQQHYCEKPQISQGKSI
jgi:hypothetical protein